VVYGGNKSAVSQITSGDKLSAQLLSLTFTTATEDLDPPMRPLEDGTFALIGQRRQMEQLLYDKVWRYAMNADARGGSNAMVKGQMGAAPYDGIRLFPFNRAPNPAANVGQAMLVGSDAFHIVKVQEWMIDQVYTDVLKRRWIIAVDAMFGAIPHIINSKRQNSMALITFVRS
jgi:hypothetical protein